jgi:hypothetical protein
MDGTIADLYGVENWLPMLIDEDPTPYEIARPLVNLSRLARYLNRLQKKGFEIGIISWLSKSSTQEYDAVVSEAKAFWLKRHLPSVKWNEIKIVPYGTNKWEVCGEGFLFDDEERNRTAWKNCAAFEPEYIFEVLAEIVKSA